MSEKNVFNQAFSLCREISAAHLDEESIALFENIVYLDDLSQYHKVFD